MPTTSEKELMKNGYDGFYIKDKEICNQQIYNDMELNEFIGKFAEAIEVEKPEELNGDTVIRDLDEWSSLTVMLLIAFFDEEFGKEIGEKELKQCITLNDLYNLAKS